MALLSFTNAVLAFIGYVIFKVAYQIVYYHFFHPLAKFPGPFWAGVTRLWIARHNLKATEVPTIYALHKKYGPVVRVTPTLLVVNDATKLPEIYHRNADKTSHYITGSFGETESLFNMREHKVHAGFRKLIAGPYSFSNIKKMEPLIDARMDSWIQKLDQKFAGSEEKFDFATWAIFMAYDVISEVGFGEAIGFIEQEKDVDGLIQGFHDGLPAFGLMCRLHPFVSWIKTTFLGKYLVAKPEDPSGIGILMRTRDKLLYQRIDDIKSGKPIDRVDLLQTFLEARTEQGKPLDEEYIRAEILLVLLAGADTTGTAFQALLSYVLAHPPVYDRMMAEIDTASRAGHLSSPIAQYSEVLEHLPYYVACVKESMRLCPSAPNIFPRYVSEPGLDLFGKFVPAGTEISCNPWIVHRDPNIYGADAEEFKPERWLDAEKAKVYNKYFFGFGYGARICLGQDIARMELYKGPLQFFRAFTPTTVAGGNGGKAGKKDDGLVELCETGGTGRFVVKGGVGFWEDVWITIRRRAQVGKE